MEKAISKLVILLSLVTSPVGAVENESRQLVELPPMMRQHMLNNMRDHLQTLAEIQQALALGDFERAGEIAEKRIGFSSLESHGAAHMAPFMPEAMQKIGTQMHQAASNFAILAQESDVDGDMKRAIGALSTLTQQCVACHASFRVQ